MNCDKENFGIESTDDCMTKDGCSVWNETFCKTGRFCLGAAVNDAVGEVDFYSEFTDIDRSPIKPDDQNPGELL